MTTANPLTDSSRHPFKYFVDFLQESVEVLSLSTRGIMHIASAVPLAEALYDYTKDFQPDKLEADAADRLASTRKEADLARREVQADFPLLHAHFLVGVWGALEAAVEDVMVAVVENDGEIRQHDKIRRVRLAYADVVTLTSEEQARAVVSELKRDLGTDNKLGVGAFEALLGIAGLTGEVSEDVKQSLFELQQLRHVIVHRRGIADKKLKHRCPWLSVAIGSRVTIGHADTVRLSNAAMAYAIQVTERIKLKYPVAESPRNILHTP